MNGYDLRLIETVVNSVKIPVIASGGAGNYQHMIDAVNKAGASAVAAASMFHFTEQTPLGAKIAMENGEVPVGAVIVSNEQIIAQSHNQTQLLNDVTAHAEIIAITSASSYLGSKYLQDCTLYVTIEPCCMCAGALKWADCFCSAGYLATSLAKRALVVSEIIGLSLQTRYPGCR